MTKFLFTTLPTNDLGLLTRSLPIARELAARGHGISFCSPASAPDRLIAKAGFENRIPKHPLYDFIARGQSIRGFVRFIMSGQWRELSDRLFNFLREFIMALPIKSTPDTL